MLKMQKAGVKTISIIDTLSELVQDGGQSAASELTAMPQPAPRSTNHGPRLSLPKQDQSSPSLPPQLKPRSPKVIVPVIDSPGNRAKLGNRVPISPGQNFQSKVPTSSPRIKQIAAASPNNVNGSSDVLDLSAISNPNNFSNGHVLVSPGSQHNSLTHFGARKKKKSGHRTKFPTSSSSRGQTPEWIKEIFLHAKLGLVDRLVSFFNEHFANKC